MNNTELSIDNDQPRAWLVLFTFCPIYKPQAWQVLFTFASIDVPRLSPVVRGSYIFGPISLTRALHDILSEWINFEFWFSISIFHSHSLF